MIESTGYYLRKSDRDKKPRNDEQELAVEKIDKAKLMGELPPKVQDVFSQA